MARITIEDCLNEETNRFTLVRLASRRAKQIIMGAKPVTDTKGNRPVVSALREIAAGKVRFCKAGSAGLNNNSPSEIDDQHDENKTSFEKKISDSINGDLLAS